MWCAIDRMICPDLESRWIHFRPGSWSFGLDVSWKANDFRHDRSDWIGSTVVVLRLLPMVEIGFELTWYSSRIAARKAWEERLQMAERARKWRDGLSGTPN